MVSQMVLDFAAEAEGNSPRFHEYRNSDYCLKYGYGKKLEVVFILCGSTAM